MNIDDGPQSARQKNTATGTTLQRQRYPRRSAQRLAGRFMLCISYFLSSSFIIIIFFLAIAWGKEISGTTRPIFTKFSGLVDMLA